MKITSFSIKRPITIFMSIIALLLFGIVSYTKLSLDMLPSINLPMLMVMTQNQGSGPEEIEKNITEPLENILATVGNMKSINSVSSEGSSMVMIQFEDGIDMDFASLEVREKIDMVKAMLPEGTMAPMIMKMNPNMMPIMNFGVSYESYSISKLSDWCSNVLKPTLERVEGVAAIDTIGNVVNEIKVTVDNSKLALNGLSTQSIMMAIRGEDTNIPIGNITEGNREILVRTYAGIDSLEDIQNVIVTSPLGGAFKLKDIAEIQVAEKESDTLGRLDGSDALIVSVQKESSANTVEVSKGINKALEKLAKENEGFATIKIFDQGEVIQFSVDSVKNNAVVGGILAILVILIFLKDIRSTIVMAVAIPISVIATFTMVYFAGLTLNMISLGGIAIGVGMLVDNSIVVIENIARLKKEGQNAIEASINGTKEVAMAITASTLTSICVFLPIVFVQGVAADIFKEMALTITFALVSSLLVSFTLVPLLASRLLNENSFNKKNNIVERLKVIYEKALRWSLKHKKSTIGILVGTLIIGFLSFGKLGIEFFPATEGEMIGINIETPKGAKMDYIIDIVDEVERRINTFEGIESIAVMISGSGTSVNAVLEENISKSKTQISNELRELTSDIPGAKIKVSGVSSQGGSGGGSVQLSVIGDDFNTLDKITQDLSDKLMSINGVIEVRRSNEKSSDEIRLVVNREKAEQTGVDIATINSAISSTFRTFDLLSTRIGDKNYNVKLYTETSLEPKLSTLEEIQIPSSTGEIVSLIDVVDIVRSEGYSSIDRINGSRKVNVTAEISGRVIGDIVSDLEKSLKDYELQDGYKISFGGEVEQMKEAFMQMAVAMILAVLLVYMVMASQFESLVKPFIIMFVVPLAIVGAILSLFLCGVTLSMPSMIGFVMLTGIIVNNGIVLVDYINRLKEEGLSTEEAIIKAGPIRLQPILMTTLTTVIGLIPMAIGIGEGSEIQMPLALTVIGGLSFGTVLTLIIVPVLYTYTDKLNRFKKVKVIKKPERVRKVKKTDEPEKAKKFKFKKRKNKNDIGDQFF